MPDAVRPTVLILGGFLTAPPVYRPLTRRLLARGAAGVVVANVWTPDWLIASWRGTAAIATRSGVALRRAIEVSRACSGGAPVLIVGHSAGGITARLLTAPEPFPGRRFGATAHVGAIVSLGTPHRLAAGAGIGRRLNEVAAEIAAEHVPGAFFAPRISYVSVASSAVVAGRRSGRGRLATLMYEFVIGRAAVPGTEGDGVVPVAATRLDGARHVLLERALHSPTAGGAWYGSDEEVDEWWPIALEAWREALAARASGAPDAPETTAAAPNGLAARTATV